MLQTPCCTLTQRAAGERDICNTLTTWNFSKIKNKKEWSECACNDIPALSRVPHAVELPWTRMIVSPSFPSLTPFSRAPEGHHQPPEGEEQRGEPGGPVLQRDSQWGPGALLVPKRRNPQPWEKCEDHRDEPRKPYHGSHGQKWRGRVPVLCARGQAVRSRLCAGGPWRSVGLGAGSAAKSPAPEHSKEGPGWHSAAGSQSNLSSPLWPFFLSASFYLSDPLIPLLDFLR